MAIKNHANSRGGQKNRPQVISQSQAWHSTIKYNYHRRKKNKIPAAPSSLNLKTKSSLTKLYSTYSILLLYNKKYTLFYVGSLITQHALELTTKGQHSILVDPTTGTQPPGERWTKKISKYEILEICNSQGKKS